MSENSRWAFLRANDFFRSTTFAGFSFVQEAKTLIEKAFWYTCICVFTAIMIRNTIETWQRYLVKPTHTSVMLASTANDSFVTNLTLQLKLSLTEFITNDPTKFASKMQLIFDGTYEGSQEFEKMMTFAENTPAQFYACVSADRAVSEKYLRNTMLDYQILDTAHYHDINYPIEQQNDWLDLFEKWLEIHKTKLSIENNVGDLRSFEFWNQEDDKNYEKLRKFLKDNNRYYVLGTKSAIFVNILQEVMKPSSAYRHSLLMTLEALKSGKDPRLKLFEQIKPFIETDKFDQTAYYRKPISLTRKQLLDQLLADNVPLKWNMTMEKLLSSLDITASQLFYAAVSAAKEMVYIKADGLESYLHDFTYDFSPTLPAEFTFILNVAKPRKNMKVKIYSRLVNRFESIYWALVDGLVELIKEDRGKEILSKEDIQLYGECKMKSELEELQVQQAGMKYTEGLYYGKVRTLLGHMHEYMFKPFVNQYESVARSSLIILDSGRGMNFMFKKPFHHYDLRLKTVTQFESMVQNCQKGSYAQCMDSCVLSLHEKHCNCSPWYLNHAVGTKNFEVCAKPCSKAEELNEEECVLKCETIMRHPCKLTNYKLDRVKLMPEDFNALYRVMHLGMGKQQPNHPVFSFTIELGDTYYPVFSEQYSIPTSVFFSNLGGQLDLWMGINIMGVIHLVLFILKLMMKININNKASRLNSKSNKMAQMKECKERCAKLEIELQALKCRIDENINKLKMVLENIQI